MKISIKQSGGYVGETIDVADVDTERLDEQSASKLRGAVAEAGFFELPAVLAAQAVGADFVRYEITTVEGDQSHTVLFEDDGSPEKEQLKKLVSQVTIAQRESPSV